MSLNCGATLMLSEIRDVIKKHGTGAQGANRAQAQPLEGVEQGAQGAQRGASSAPAFYEPECLRPDAPHTRPDRDRVPLEFAPLSPLAPVFRKNYTPAALRRFVAAGLTEEEADREWLRYQIDPLLLNSAHTLATEADPCGDDRVSCATCTQLTADGLCFSRWKRGAYRPNNQQRHQLFRCASFAPLPNDHDQRRGEQRWPGLSA